MELSHLACGPPQWVQKFGSGGATPPVPCCQISSNLGVGDLAGAVLGSQVQISACGGQEGAAMGPQGPISAQGREGAALGPRAIQPANGSHALHLAPGAKSSSTTDFDFTLVCF